MKPTILLAEATTDDGRLMTLHEHDGEFQISVAGVPLMSTRQHHSERRLAELACEHLSGRQAPRMLIGGLGLGFTLRAALEGLGPDAQVTVVELLPAVVEWNRNPDYRLAAGELEDPRVELVVGDVADVIRERPRGFDAILLDVDNGASELTTVSNKELYQAESLQRARAGLRAGGCLAIWSADKDPAFVERMELVGFSVTTERVPAYPGGKVYNWLFAGVV
ncbi:MAG: spermidine synthase [Pirellulales bacterium]|nr:spermidine synthase [Pirellulales bacterium]